MKKITTKKGELKWQADVVVNGRRMRPQFDTKKQAEEFERDAKLRAAGLPEIQIKERKRLVEAIRQYGTTVSVTKDSHDSERHYFDVLNEAMSDREILGFSIEHVDEIELLHLQSLQTFLVKKSIHSRCFRTLKKAELEKALKLRETDGAAGELALDQWTEDWPVLKPTAKCKADPEHCRKHVLAASTVNRYFHAYQDFFNSCAAWKFVKPGENPMLELGQIPESPEVKKVHPPETTQAVIDDLDSHGEQAAADALFGMNEHIERPSTLARVVWSDVDLVENSIVFKTKKGDGTLRTRKMPLSDKASAFYREKFDRARRAFQARPTDLVYRSASGGPLNSQALARSVARACERLGIGDFTAYCVRHGGVTKLRRMKVSIADIGDTVGHSNLNTTRNTYSHMDAEDLRPVVDAFSKDNKVERRRGS